MTESQNSRRSTGRSPGTRPLFEKARTLLEQNKLSITKDWLNRIIQEVDDLSTLESFPTQESISASVELIDGIADALHSDGVLAEFEPGGRLYEQAALLGYASGSGREGLANLSRQTATFENSIWGLLKDSLRRDDQQLLDLVVALRRCLRRMEDAAAATYYDRSVGELDRLAHTDPLTGLYNRRYLIQELDRHIEMYKRYRHPFSLLMLDVNELKSVNDNYGHAAGDAALEHVAAITRATVRDVDIVCRFGGDEFMVLMPQTEAGVVRTVGDRVRESLGKTKLKVGDSLINLEASTGWASCPDDGKDAEELIQSADMSLYRSKRRGPEQESG